MTRLIVAACILALVVAMGCERVVDLTRAPGDAGSIDAFDDDAFAPDATLGDGFTGGDGNDDGGIASDVGGPSDV